MTKRKLYVGCRNPLVREMTMAKLYQDEMDERLRLLIEKTQELSRRNAAIEEKIKQNHDDLALIEAGLDQLRDGMED